jgi:ribonuclease HII
VSRREQQSRDTGSDRPAASSRGKNAKRWSPIERELRATIGPLLAGVDEVGRGPLAGPVVACAVIMPPDRKAIRGVDDSKKIAAGERERLAAVIMQRAVAVALGAASVREIDRINIYQASRLAMQRALARLGVVPDHVLVDGRHIRTLPIAHTAVVHGDSRCFSIACASIIAKVTRDRLMCALARRHPGYLWERNAGYTTKAHVAGLASHGITAHHRRSFWRVSQLTLDFDAVLPDEDELLGDTEADEIRFTASRTPHHDDGQSLRA